MTPENLKYTKIAIGSIVGLTVLYFIFGNSDNGGGSDDGTGNNNGGNSGGNLAVFDAKKVASTLFEAMNKFGTDESKIVNTLRYITPAQFNLVWTAFGRKHYSDYFGYATSTADYQNLGYWLEAELSEEEYQNLKRKYTILS